MQVHNIHLGDTLTPFGFRLRRPDGSIPDVDGKTVVFSMFNAAGVAVVDEQPAEFTDTAEAEGQYDFQAAEVGTAGTFKAYVILVDGAEKEHFPPETGELVVVIHGNT